MAKDCPGIKEKMANEDVEGANKENLKEVNRDHSQMAVEEDGTVHH